MPTNPVSKNLICPDCGATISPQAIRCWLCARLENAPQSATVLENPRSDFVTAVQPSTAKPPGPTMNSSLRWFVIILAVIGTLPAVLVAFFVTCVVSNEMLVGPANPYVGLKLGAEEWGLIGALVVFLLMLAFIGQYALVSPRRNEQRRVE